MGLLMIASLIRRASGLGGGDLLDGGRNAWLLCRAEELAVVKAGELCFELFAKLIDGVRDKEEGLAKKEFYAKSGKFIRVLDQLQLIVLNALGHKKKCHI